MRDEVRAKTMAEYLRALSANALTIGAVAVLLALLAGLQASRSSARSERTYDIRIASADAAAVGVTGLSADVLGVPDPDVVARSATESRRRLLPELPSTATVSAAGSNDLARVRVIGVGASDAEADAQAKAFADAIVARERAAISARLDRVSQLLAAQLDDATKQVAAARAGLAGAATGGASAAEVELVQALAEQAGIRRALTAVGELRQTGLTIVGEPEPVGDVRPVPSSGPLTFGILGFVLGAVLAAGAVLVWTFFDCRVRSRADLERILADVPVLGAVVGEGTADDYLAPAVALARALPATGSNVVHLMVVGDVADRQGAASALVAMLERAGRSAALGSLQGDSDAAALAARLRADGGDRLVLVPTGGVEAAGDAALVASVAAGSVLLVAAGRARDVEVATAGSMVRAAGGTAVGQVLLGVRRRDAAWAPFSGVDVG